MARLIAFLVLFLVIVYGVWPYYGLYRLDQALSQPDAEAIAPFVDLQAIRAHYKERLSSGVDRIVPEGQPDEPPILSQLAQGIRDLGGKAVDQIVSLDVVRTLLRQAAIQATDKRPAYFLAGVDYAFFASPTRFQVRLGKGEDATQVIMSLEGINWRITDITPARYAIFAPAQPDT